MDSVAGGDPSTARKGGTGTLFDTGRLFRSIQLSAESSEDMRIISTDVPYAKDVHPRWPFMGVNQDDSLDSGAASEARGRPHSVEHLMQLDFKSRSLKPCPFCGKTPRVSYQWGSNIAVDRVQRSAVQVQGRVLLLRRRLGGGAADMEPSPRMTWPTTQPTARSTSRPS